MNGRLVLVASLFLVTSLSAVPNHAAQADAHPTGACSAPFHVGAAGWDFCWQQEDARAQGIELNQVYFQGSSVLWKIGVPFSMTKYDNPSIGPYKDTLGYPSQGGHSGYGLGTLTIPPADCPRFYMGSGTLLNGGKLCVETRDGPEPAVAIWARYNIYNYRFMQGYRFDARGHIEPFVRMGGLLIDGNSGENGANHFHHLMWRADFDIAGDSNDYFESFHRNVGLPVNTPSILGSVPCGIGRAPVGVDGWCRESVEGYFTDNSDFMTKWRVTDSTERNSLGRLRGYEFDTLGTVSADTFGTMDMMVVQYKGDNVQLGYEVPTNPTNGDTTLYQYFTPAETITDPVVWIFQHSFHDTRDEDRGSMSYHEEYPFLQPRSFMNSNPGEYTYP